MNKSEFDLVLDQIWLIDLLLKGQDAMTTTSPKVSENTSIESVQELNKLLYFFLYSTMNSFRVHCRTGLLTKGYRKPSTA